MSQYIVLEGVKGVGKSTVFQLLKEYLLQNKVVFEEVCPTRKQTNNFSFWECAYGYCQNDWVKERVYAYRANLAAQNANWHSPLIIGDRSIITSYVTRFWKYNYPKIHINRVDKLESLLPAPNLVLYLSTDIDHIVQRIQSRKDRDYGKEDETETKIIQDLAAYQELRKNHWATKLANTQWVDIDCSQNPQAVLDEIVYQVKRFLKSTNHEINATFSL